MNAEAGDTIGIQIPLRKKKKVSTYKRHTAKIIITANCRKDGDPDK